ncbi:hypothetical protein ASO20_01335 [Mycoplasma sp. (ex Biomphalaria glabrata)]|uniref:ATP synthase F1 subunit epsilon n=1 Tax=Mycoplasma sp. (ex Biomphalaria glabrata) TaxID=1749074 RepID=UPI00073A8043|nr:ATP synthase F1 subunit epsilon [Mycoplasma sp. (ex Biomphalaria glabrata)]ALV23297.1 hypothetical protein ASO20_01335 [Mycoplasma sp. (ex Biomphalaria glabrata)]
MEFSLKIVSPMGIFFEGKVTSLNVKTSDGYSGILPNHAPIIAPIEPSVLKFSQGEKIFVAVIANGFLYLEPNSARILTDEIVYEKDVDELRASKLLELEQRKLNDIKNKEDEILIRSQIKYFTSQINVKKGKF